MRRPDARYDDFLTALAGTATRISSMIEAITGMHADRAHPLRADASRRASSTSSRPFRVRRGRVSGDRGIRRPSSSTKLVPAPHRRRDHAEGEWQPAVIDIGVAFQGLVSLMNEQKEKVNNAATGQEESRYAQMTLFDLPRTTSPAPAPSTASSSPGSSPRRAPPPRRTARPPTPGSYPGFQTLHALYDSDPGDASPTPAEGLELGDAFHGGSGDPLGVLWSSV